MRDVKRILFSAMFAVVCHLALASLAFGGGVPCDVQANAKQGCPCLEGGFCPCGEHCACGEKAAATQVAVALVALHAGDEKSGPAPAAVKAPVQQTYHYEMRCNGRTCVQCLVPDAAPAAGTAAACPPAACAGCSTMTTSTCYQSAESPSFAAAPMRSGGRRLLYRVTHPFQGRQRSGGCSSCGG
jgi:hypothetical protein